MKKILILLINFLCVISFSLSFNEIDNITQKYIDNKTIPGSVILVSKNGKILYYKAFGDAQIDQKRKMKKDTIFDLASMTKILATTQSIMNLYYEGKINLDDKVVKYIPEFGQNGKENIRIKDLLTHTSGLTPWLPIYYHAKNKKEVLNFICSQKLEYETGKERKYSDLGFMTLGFIVEKVSGKDLDKYVYEKIYKPLNLKRTLFLPRQKFSESEIAATSFGNPYEEKMIKDPNFGFKVDEKYEDFRYFRNYTLVGEVNDGNSFYAGKGVLGHAGLFSDIYGVYVLGELFLNGGTYKNVKLYDKNIRDLFITKQSEFGHGYGYEINRGGEKTGYMGPYSNEFFVGHTGFTGTQFVYDVKNKVQVIILTNKQNLGVLENGSYKSTWPYAREVMQKVGQLIYK